MSRKLKTFIALITSVMVNIATTGAGIFLLVKCSKYIPVLLHRLLGLVATVFAFTFLFIDYYKGPDEEDFPTPPAITYGEFPYEIEYSINGEKYETSDSFIFEYTTKYEFGGKVTWNWGTLYSLDILLYETDEYRIYIDGGYADYYMQYDERYEDYSPGQCITRVGEGGAYKKYTLEEAKEQLGIEIISAQFSEPIENYFPEE